MRRQVVLSSLVAAVVLVGLMAQPGAAVNVPQPVVVSADPATPIPRSNIFAFDAATGAIDPNFAPVMDNEVESLAVAPDGLQVFAGGRFTKINGVAQKSLAKLRLSDGARITQFKGKTNARVKDMAQSGGQLYIGGTFSTVDGAAQVA